MKLAVVGGGWAGLAAAVRAVESGHGVSLFEMAGQLGGRARSADVDGACIDNGQHILIGAYTRTLSLMKTLGVDSGAALHRQPLELRFPDGRGLRVPAGPAWLGLGRAVLGCVGWSAADRLALLAAVARWAAAGFSCPAHLTVDALCRKLSPAVRELLIDPLCVAALNTHAAEASAAVWLRVLRDALFGGVGSADLLLPRLPLSALLPDPAAQWLRRAGAQVRLRQRVQTLRHAKAVWQIDGEPFDAVVLACTAAEAARLTAQVTPDWSEQARALRYEPIVTVNLGCPGARLPAAMTALVPGPGAPAQFAFDHGALGLAPGVFVFVVSGARHWAAAGAGSTAAAVLQQAQQAFDVATWPSPPKVLRVMTEKRATFRCTPGLQRPPGRVAAGLVAAGDYIAGPYPATLEGAVRSGEAAIAALAP